MKVFSLSYHISLYQLSCKSQHDLGVITSLDREGSLTFLLNLLYSYFASDLCEG